MEFYDIFFIQLLYDIIMYRYVWNFFLLILMSIPIIVTSLKKSTNSKKIIKNICLVSFNEFYVIENKGRNNTLSCFFNTMFKII